MILALSSISGCLEFLGEHPGLLLVLIGVVGEVVCDWKEMGGRLAKAKRLSAILLVVGLTMEFWEAAKSDSEVADTKERAANAEKEASQANERAAKFDSDRVLIEKQAAEIQSTNYLLQATVLQLEGKLKPRNLTSEQITNLIASLSVSPQKGKISILASVLDSEATAFAEQIDDVFTKSGFEVHRPSGFSSDSLLMVGPPGINIAVKDITKPSPQAAYIYRCFRSAGIEMMGLNSSSSNIDSNSIEINIGQK